MAIWSCCSNTRAPENADGCAAALPPCGRLPAKQKAKQGVDWRCWHSKPGLITEHGSALQVRLQLGFIRRQAQDQGGCTRASRSVWKNSCCKAFAAVSRLLATGSSRASKSLYTESEIFS